MENIKITTPQLETWFDLEDFMNFSHETRLENEIFEKLAQVWEEWQALLKIAIIESGKNSWLAVWLPEEVEKIIESAWAEAPSQGFLYNNLAQYLCMSVVQELLPQAADGGCAPSPSPTATLREALTKAGLNYHPGSDILERRFALVTFYPFKGGCEICHLKTGCPKGKGTTDFASIVLPGFERSLIDNK